MGGVGSSVGHYTSWVTSCGAVVLLFCSLGGSSRARLPSGVCALSICLPMMMCAACISTLKIFHAELATRFTNPWMTFKTSHDGRRLTLTINYICNWRTLNRCHQAIIARWLPPTSASRPARVLPGIQIICRMVPTSMLICISVLSSENRLFPELATSLWLCDVLSALTALPGITQLVKPSAAFKTQLGHCLSWEAFTPSSTR